MLDLHNARDINTQIRRTTLFAGSFALGLSLSLIHDPASPFRWGLLVGTLVSIIYSFLIYNRLRHIGQLPINKAVAFMRIGFVMRLTLVMAVLYLSISTDLIDIYGVALGLFIAPVISVIDFNFSLIKKYRAQLAQKDEN